VPIAAFQGDDPVEATTIDVGHLGPSSQRRDWNIRSQRPETAYPLWRTGRGIPDTLEEAAGDYVLIIRDVDGAFHARWLRGSSLAALPLNIREAMLAVPAGVLFL
jgi:hypothetical protein